MTEDELLYKNYFRHFSARLSLRYGILITFECYVSICKLPFVRNAVRHKRKDGKGYCLIGTISIQDTPVRIVKSTCLNGRPLLTALTPLK